MYRAIVLLWLGLIALLPSVLMASEVGTKSTTNIEIELAPVWWQYEELSGARAGFATTPLKSSAQGYGAELGAVLHHRLDENWQFMASWKNIFPIYKATETWQLANGVQSNQLRIAQSELHLEVLRKLYGADLGLWTSYQWHLQSRQKFRCNGVLVCGGKPVSDNDKPIRETVQTLWAGVALQAESDNALVMLRLEGGLPMWVYTTNSSVVGAFTRRSGFRMGGSASILLPWQQGTEARLAVAYQYRELGNELLQTTSQWLWPSNRWQTLSLEMSLRW
ncbi:MAG: hypothetical protein Q9M20_07665 [Mariprofundaceae bacterium]|nr:hypothetical protein [Mariprofundaceae bacterium]